jgi:hypothetical protein
MRRAPETLTVNTAYADTFQNCHGWVWQVAARMNVACDRMLPEKFPDGLAEWLMCVSVKPGVHER